MLLHDWVRRTVTVEHFVNSSHPIAFPAKLHALVDILDMKWMWNDTPGWFAVCWRNRVVVGTASELQWSQKGLHLKLLSNRLSHLSSSKNAIWNWRSIIAIASSITHFPTVSGCISQRSSEGNVLLGGFGTDSSSAGASSGKGRQDVSEVSAMGFVGMLFGAKKVVIVPGFLGLEVGWVKSSILVGGVLF